MKPKVVIVAVALVMLLSLSGCHGVPTPPAPAPTDVVVVESTGLDWADVVSGDMPFTSDLAQRSAIGLLVSRDPASAETLLGELDVTGGRTVGTRRATGAPGAVDREIADAVSSASAASTVVVLSVPTATSPGVVIVSGEAYAPGLLESASTRRAGLVTDEDIVATVRVVADAGDASDASTGVSVASDKMTGSERVAHLARVESALLAMEGLRRPLQSVYTVLMTLLILGGWWLAEKARTSARFGYWSTVMRRAILFGLCVPAAGTLLHVVDRYPASPERTVSLLFATGGLVWLFSQFAWHRWGTAAGVSLASIVTAAVVAIDQLAGAPLTVSSAFSYSPVSAFRFYGLGNEGAAILVGALVTGIALELDAADAPDPVRRRTIAIAGAVAVAVAAAPFLGANAVVAVWGTFTFAALYVAAERRRVRLKDAVFTLVAVVGAVGAVVLLSRLMPDATHISRAVEDVSGGGLVQLLASRAATSLRIFTGSPLPAIVLLLAIGFGYLRVRPLGRLRTMLERYPVFAAAIVAGLAGGAVGMVVEDSGVVVLALILLYLAGATVMLMLVPEAEEGSVR
ncbi:MAG: hypothetical protein WBI63_08935 [Coriobacteriia bacterium]